MYYSEYIDASFENDVLFHHGIKGMKWGVRRYQNPDGTLTAKGRAHNANGKIDAKVRKDITKRVQKSSKTASKQVYDRFSNDFKKTKAGKEFDDYRKDIEIKFDSDGRPTSYTFHNGKTMTGLMEQRNKYVKEFTKYQKKHYNEMASAVLSDIGYEDTQAGRDYLKKLGLV